MTGLPILRESADEVTLFDPGDGSVIELGEASSDTLVLIRELIRDAEEEQRIAKRQIDAELIERMDRSAKWTIDAGGVKITAPSPTPVDEYDAHALRAELEDACARGLITQDAVDSAVQMIVDYKAMPGGIKALRKLGGEVDEIIKRHHSTSERIRRVTVKR